MDLRVFSPFYTPSDKLNSRAQNIQTVIVARLLAGAFGSTSSAMVGGTIADIWAPHECVLYCPRAPT